MNLHNSVKNSLNQLEDSLNLLTNQQYSQKSEILFGASVGQHVRHVVEMFMCLQNGYFTGVVNYENRKRELVLENSKEAAVELIHAIQSGLYFENKDLILEAGFDIDTNETNNFATNYFREIAYNLEHTIHHMALIRIGINIVSDIALPKEYGVASSTVKYLRKSNLGAAFPQIAG